MPDAYVTVSAEDLRVLVSNKMASAGMPRRDADIVADVLVYSDLRGVHSHGALRVEHYLRRIEAGGMNLEPDFELRRLKPSIALLDAKGAAGHVSMKFAAERAVEMAAEQGIALVGVKNNSHCGPLAYYAEIALKRKMAVLVLGNVNKLVVPFGGTEPFFGTNPLAFGYPGETDDMLLDMATSEIAWGKVLAARETGTPLEPGLAFDAEGNECTDPHRAAALTPFGGAKGSGVAMMVEALTGLLVGGVFGPHLKEMYGDYDKYRDLSNLIVAIDPAVFWGGDGFLRTAQNMIDELRRIEPAPGFERVAVPGENARRTMAKYAVSGIPLPRGIYDFLAGARAETSS